ncbi:UNVERIFIED_CONTAM: hypothetical protein K2H54_004873 [Gekko kuhli]
MGNKKSPPMPSFLWHKSIHPTHTNELITEPFTHLFLFLNKVISKHVKQQRYQCYKNIANIQKYTLFFLLVKIPYKLLTIDIKLNWPVEYADRRIIIKRGEEASPLKGRRGELRG